MAAPKRPRFDPAAHGLAPTFSLLAFSKLKGCSCKVPREDLLALLEGLGDGHIGMDSSVMPTQIPGVQLVQTTDFFYPVVEDPYMQGRITAANVLSDLYAMGITHCDNMLMLLSTCLDMTPLERDVVTRLMIQGYHDLAREAGCLVTGGQTVRNPWVIIGGVASAVVAEGAVLLPHHALPGDVLVLTKPLGTQVAVNAYQWLSSNPDKWATIAAVTTPDAVRAAYHAAEASMARLNRDAAALMKPFGAKASTDVTGFGLMGHATNLVGNQLADVSFHFHTLPLFAGVRAVAEKTSFRLLEGYSAETSGGLLVVLPAERAQAYCERLLAESGQPAWIVGDVVAAAPGARAVTVAANVKTIDVPDVAVPSRL